MWGRCTSFVGVVVMTAAELQAQVGEVVAARNSHSDFAVTSPWRAQGSKTVAYTPLILLSLLFPERDSELTARSRQRPRSCSQKGVNKADVPSLSPFSNDPHHPLGRTRKPSGRRYQQMLSGGWAENALDASARFTDGCGGERCKISSDKNRLGCEVK